MGDPSNNLSSRETEGSTSASTFLVLRSAMGKALAFGRVTLEDFLTLGGLETWGSGAGARAWDGDGASGEFIWLNML